MKKDAGKGSYKIAHSLSIAGNNALQGNKFTFAGPVQGALAQQLLQRNLLVERTAQKEGN